MTSDQLSVFKTRAIDRPARSHRIVGAAFAAAVLEDQLVALHTDPRERRRMRRAIEEAAGKLIAVLRDLEPVHLVGIGAGAGEVPASDERVLLPRDDRRGGDYPGDLRQLHAHDVILMARGTEPRRG